MEFTINIPARCLENLLHNPPIPMPRPSNWDEDLCEHCSMFLICQSIKNTETVLENIEKALNGDDGQSD